MSAYAIGATRHDYSTSGKFRAVTPNDSTDLTGGVCRALWVGGAGNVAVHDSEGNAVTFVGVAAGSTLPVRTNRVMSTNTTATSIVALF